MRTLLVLLRIGLNTLGTALLTGVVVAGLAVAVLYFYITPRLPDSESLRDQRLQVPLRVYASDGGLMAEFGEKRRIPVDYAEVPEPLIKAFLAAEDDRFFEHPGVDYQGLLRAGVELVRTGEKRQGGSTITMQVARNYFLSSEKTYLRKASEILLALKIEREFSKPEILAMYLNKIYFGHRAYGVAAAAQIYYGATLEELSLAQMAMIAGLPKAPSRYNPITNPPRALIRRNYILGRMRDLGYIDDTTYRAAFAEPDRARHQPNLVEVEAPYVAEMVRAQLVEQYGTAVYEQGWRVTTTLDRRLQAATNAALRNNLLDYDRRHGYRGPERRVPVPTDATGIDKALADSPTLGGLEPAIVTSVAEKSAEVALRGGRTASLPWSGLSWARPYISADRRGASPSRASAILAPGDVIRVARTEEPEGWRLAQLPAAEAALVVLSPRDGAILGLAGGFDFLRSKFNRVTQAERQPGSSFKPFIYSAALEKGFTAASLINDAPLVFQYGNQTWKPENYGGKFYGPTRLRDALTHSINLVSIRLLQSIGVKYAAGYVSAFGIPPERTPQNLSLALGTGTLKPLELAAAYAVFANGGFRVAPYFIDRIDNEAGEPIFQAQPAVACPDCDSQAIQTVAIAANSGDERPTPTVVATTANGEPVAPRVITAQNAYLMTSLMRDVIQLGTARRALKMGRGDLAGKTGTTNDQRDAWFCGYNSDLVTVAWTGFDDLSPLGDGETGGRAALPMWMGLMEAALADVPEQPLPMPPGLTMARINKYSGRSTTSDDPDAIFETFLENALPAPALDYDDYYSDYPQDAPVAGDYATEQPSLNAPELLF